MRAESIVDSASVGDPTRFRTLDELQLGLGDMATVDPDRGTVALIVLRGQEGRREAPERLMLTPEEGVPGDAWNRKENATVQSQITVMQAKVADLIANGQPRTLFGDNLFLDLDLSAGNLPPGSRVRVGEAVLEVTLKPHRGCSKFSGRFGADALRFVSTPEGHSRNFRGLYMRVLTAGEAGPGDLVEVIERGSVSEETTD